MQTNSVICADALTVCVDDRTLLDNLNFNVGKGEVFALLGGNGAGKSTTMKMITGFLAPTRGTVRVCGYDVLTFSEFWGLWSPRNSYRVAVVFLGVRCLFCLCFCNSLAS